jgi:hypothetical protein
LVFELFFSFGQIEHGVEWRMGGSGRQKIWPWDDGVQMGKGEDTRGGMGLMADVGEDELAGTPSSLLEGAAVRVPAIR